MSKKVTVREVKKALELAGVDVKEVFKHSWNDLRKSGRRIKMSYSTNDLLSDELHLKIGEELDSMFPNNTFNIRNHISVDGWGGKYDCLTVHVK